jgi:dTDP-4-dehydrorhamnose 3,5-epimerase
VTLQIEETPLAGVKLIHPKVLTDPRGYFLELSNVARLSEAGIKDAFVQVNLSRSRHGVVRGLHYQFPTWQAKLVSVLDGEVVDVAVDLRHGSATFGRSFQSTLSAANARQMYIPEGFAHGFAVVSESALVHYECTRLYVGAEDRTLLWNDPSLGIDWPFDEPVLSEKDRRGQKLADASHLRAAPGR